jgi:hypothetical protein
MKRIRLRESSAGGLGTLRLLCFPKQIGKGWIIVQPFPGAPCSFVRRSVVRMGGSHEVARRPSRTPDDADIEWRRRHACLARGARRPNPIAGDQDGVCRRMLNCGNNIRHCASVGKHGRKGFQARDAGDGVRDVEIVQPVDTGRRRRRACRYSCGGDGQYGDRGRVHPARSAMETAGDATVAHVAAENVVVAHDDRARRKGLWAGDLRGGGRQAGRQNRTGQQEAESSSSPLVDWVCRSGAPSGVPWDGRSIVRKGGYHLAGRVADDADVECRSRSRACKTRGP